MSESIAYSIFLIFTGAAVFATLALFARQAMIVGYILLGVVLGPSGVALIDDATLSMDISHIGIIFLLYLLGLDLLPQQLMQMLGKALIVTLASSVSFGLLGCSIGFVFGYSVAESLFIGAVMMFSSTIIGLKLLPTTILHHKHTGQIIISILLLQDLLAIIVLLLLQGFGKGDNIVVDFLLQMVVLLLLIGGVWFVQRYVLIKLISMYDQIHEYIFLLAIAWCLSVSEFAAVVGLSHEIGAFIAGVSLAASPIALFITDRLKPLRDFFLIIFFFSLGVGFNINLLGYNLIMPAVCLALLTILVKPKVFALLLKAEGEKKYVSREVGFRLGQGSEFSLLITVLAEESRYISEATANMIQFSILLTFIVSSFIIVRSYPTPIATTSKLRRD